MATAYHHANYESSTNESINTDTALSVTLVLLWIFCIAVIVCGTVLVPASASDVYPAIIEVM